MILSSFNPNDLTREFANVFCNFHSLLYSYLLPCPPHIQTYFLNNEQYSTLCSLNVTVISCGNEF